MVRRPLRALVLIGVLRVVLLPVKALDLSNPLSSLADIFNKWFNDVLIKTSQAIFEFLRGVLVYLVQIPRPADLESIRHAWCNSFDIYLFILLPLSLVILGIFVMFFRTPLEYTIDEYVKRICFATLLAYFSFTIVDSLVWLTNEISNILVKFFVPNGDALAIVYGKLIGLAGAIAGAAVLLPALVPLLGIMVGTVIVILALRVILVYVLLVAMPILCFFLIIAVGPLRRLGDVVEHVWGILIALPILSIIGAIILGLMAVIEPPTNNLGGAILITLGPLFMVFAYPSLVTSFMGAFSGAAGEFVGIVRHVAHKFGPIAEFRAATARVAGGLAAPFYMALPQPIVARLHEGFANIGNKIRRIIPSFGGLYAPTATLTTEKPFRPNTLLLGRSLADIGAISGAFGTLAALARRGTVSATNPQARGLFRAISGDLGKLYKRGDISAFKEGVLAFTRSRSVPEAFKKVIADNLAFAKEVKDPSIIGLSSLLSGLEIKDFKKIETVDPKTGRKIVKSVPIVDIEKSVKNIRNIMANNPEVTESLLKGSLGKSFISALIGERDFGRLLQGDENAIRKLVERAESLGLQVAPTNNTFLALVRNESPEDLAHAFKRDVKDVYSIINTIDDPEKRNALLDRVVYTYSQATGLSEEAIRKAFEEVKTYPHVSPYELESVKEVVKALKEDPGRAITTLGTEMSENVIDTYVSDILATKDDKLREEKIVNALGEFLSSGGLVKKEITPEEAKLYADLHRTIVRRKLSQARLSDHFWNAMNMYHKYFTRIDPTTYDPEHYYQPEHKALSDSLDKVFKGV